MRSRSDHQPRITLPTNTSQGGQLNGIRLRRRHRRKEPTSTTPIVVDVQGQQISSKRINQNEAALLELFNNDIQAHQQVPVVVDQPSNIGRLTVAVAQKIGGTLQYLPGLAIRQQSQIHASHATTDIPDAYVIAHERTWHSRSTI